LVNSVNSAIASALFGGSSTTSSVAGVSADLLAAWAASKAGVGVNVGDLTRAKDAPLTEVWTPGISPSDAGLVDRAFANRAFFDINAKLYSDLGATGDYRRLFALYNGVSTLKALASQAGDSELSNAARTQTMAQFSRGLTELSAFLETQKFDDIRLSQGDRVDKAQSTLALPVRSEDYTTGVIHRGGLYSTVSGLDPNAAFKIVATSAAGTKREVSIDLSEMGSLSRSLSNVITYVNGKLSAAGASSRLEAADLTPKTSTIVVAGKTIESRYTGSKQYGLKVDVRANESVSFEPVGAEPAFYAIGTTQNGASLIKLSDVGDADGEPNWLTRPQATADPIGSYVATGWYGPGAPYTSGPAGAAEFRSGLLLSDDFDPASETWLNNAGDAVLTLDLGDGRTVSVSTAWRTGDQETWRTRAGESEDRALIDDLAERLTQLLHEQGVAGGVDVWEDNGELGLSVFTGGVARPASLTIGGKAVSLDLVETSETIGGLTEAAFARRFEVAGIAATGALFEGKQAFAFTSGSTTSSFTIDGGEDGLTAEELAEQINNKLRQKNIAAAAYLVDDGGTLTLRIDALHQLDAVSATIDGTKHDLDLQVPGAWASGGLPNAAAGSVFADTVRTYAASEDPLVSNAGALDIEIVVDMPTGAQTITVSISAQERLDNPDAGPGQWNALFQERLDAALNAAGVYVAAPGGDLRAWQIAEGAGQRIASVSVNGAPLTLSADAPAFGLGGAVSAERSFTSAEAASGVSDDVAALLSDGTVSITFTTAWGERTVSAALQPSDPASLESAELRLNEALGAAGYDLGVAATALAGGGAGLRIVTGGSHTVRGVTAISLGADSITTTLDPIDSASYLDDPLGSLRVADRAARGTSAIETIAEQSSFKPPSTNATAWFPGRAFDVGVGDSAQAATARAVATGSDGSVYVLADLSGDSSALAIKGGSDVALLKYNSAGQLQFTQVLGAADEASGFALAVSADGARVAVAGAVEGGLNGTTAKGGDDSFVAVFASDGEQLWSARRGASGDDQVNAIAFASDGSVFVAGQTESALPGAVSLGQRDGYLRGYSSAGLELFTREFGTSGTDAATALLVRDKAGGGFDIFTGGVESNRGVVRSFTYSNASGVSQGATRDIGYFYNGAINALAVDGDVLYVAGAIGADRLTLGAPARASVAGQEGFVARINDDLTSSDLDRASYLGSTGEDSVKSLALVDGVLYAAGVAGGAIAGQGAGGKTASFLTRLGDDGDAAWTRTFNSSGGAFSLTGLAVDTSGASALDVLGLPRGQIAAFDNQPLVQRSALREGDEFRIGIDGRRLSAIKITADETLTSLAAKITRAIAGAGRAKVVSEDGVERIVITPSAGKAIRVDPGREGHDALDALGFKQGVIATNAEGFKGVKSYGLGLLAADFDLTTEKGAQAAVAELSAALSIVRQAYEALVSPYELTDEQKALEERRKNAGAAPAYITDQYNNYRAALVRLTGGS
jgi:hypothetical protein